MSNAVVDAQSAKREDPQVGVSDPASSTEGQHFPKRKRYSSKSLRGTRSTTIEIKEETPDAQTIHFGSTKPRPSVTSLDFSKANGSPTLHESGTPSERGTKVGNLSPRLRGIPALHIERSKTSENNTLSFSSDSVRSSSPHRTPERKKKSHMHPLQRARTISVDAITASKLKSTVSSLLQPPKYTTARGLDQLSAAALAAEQHTSISINTARRRLNEVQRPSLRRNTSFGGYENHRRVDSNDSVPRLGSSPLPSPRGGHSRSPSESAVSTPRSTSSITSDTRTAGSTLQRTTSEPFLHSWEYENLEVDLWVEGIGYVLDYLEKRWRRKRRMGKPKRRKTLKRQNSQDSSHGDLEASSESTTSSTVEGEKSDIVYQVDGDENVIVAGSKERLLRSLADANVQDKEYLDIFLSTHLHFISSLDLLDFLIKLYMHPLEDSVLTDEGLKSVIRVRVINVLKKWARNYAYEFHASDVKKALAAFVERLEAGEGGAEAMKWAAFLRSAWKTSEAEDTDGFESSTKPPRPLVPKKVTMASQLTFLEIQPLEFARQLTLLHHSMFAPIQNPHLISVLKDPNDERNPVTKITNFSNTITRWVLTAVVNGADVKRRTAVVAHFIRVCSHLVEINNYHGALDIFLGLSHYIVSKLRKTWRNLDNKSHSQWKSLVDLFTPSGGWRNLRKRTVETSPPIVIPPAIWLHDILSIGENDDYWDEETKLLINFEKMRLFASVFKHVYRCQVERYNFVPVDILQEFILKCLNPMPSISAISAIAQNLGSQEGTEKPPKKDKEKEAKDAPRSPIRSDSLGQVKRRASFADLFKSKISSPKK